jgi:phage terminase large subunit
MNEQKEFIFPKMHIHQFNFATAKARFPLSIGGMGSGKSLGLIERCHFLMIKTPYFGDLQGNVGLLGRDTLKNLKRTTMADFFEFCPPSFIKRFDKQDNVVEYVNGSLLYFVHFEKDIDYRSMNLGFAGFDQLEDCPEKVWDEISIHRLRRTHGRLQNNPIDFHSAFGVANPCSNWVSQIWESNELLLESKDETQKEKYDPDYLTIHSSMRDNAEFLPPDFILNAEKKYKNTPHKGKMYIDGLWGALEGSTYEWKPDLITENNEIPLPHWKVKCGLDHGVSAPKAVCFVALEETGYRTVLHVYDELYEPNMGTDVFVGLIDERLQSHAFLRRMETQREPIEAWLCDPAMLQGFDFRGTGKKKEKITYLKLYQQYAQERNLPLTLIPGESDIISGIDKVNFLFRENLVKVSPKCINFIREHKNLVNDPDNDGKPKEGQADHLCTAFKYLVSSLNMTVLFPSFKNEMTEIQKKYNKVRKRALIKPRTDSASYLI